MGSNLLFLDNIMFLQSTIELRLDDFGFILLFNKHLHFFRRWQIFTIFDPQPPGPLPSTVSTTLCRKIWQIFDPSPPKKCRRPKLMVPKLRYPCFRTMLLLTTESF